jgi:uncharacterized repeat protein (TIGR01451 family)
MTRIRNLAVVAMSILSMGACAASAGAAGLPDGCTTSALNASFVSDPGDNDVLHIHRVGDQMQIAVSIRNDASGACTVDDATVTVTEPGSGGSAGASTIIATNQTFAGGMHATTLPTAVPYTVAFDPGVFRGPVSISVTGQGHFPGGTTSTTTGLTSTVVVTRPHATLTIHAGTASGPIPLTVTYTYTLLNDTPIDFSGDPTHTPSLEPPSQSATPDGTAITDDVCGTPGYVPGGDTHVSSPAAIDVGETWSFSCTHTFTDPGTFTSHAAVAGTSSRDADAWPATTAQSTVAAMGPDLTLALSHAGDFTAGDTGRTYTILATNSGNTPTTSAPASVTDTLPAGLTATAIAGTGWTCVLQTLTCTRSNVLTAGASYPPITLTTDVAAGAPPTVTNTATISGGGQHPSADDTASDPTTIVPIPVAIAIPPAATLTAAVSLQSGALIPPPAPSNRFTIKQVKPSKTGTAVFTLSAPDAGAFALGAVAGRVNAGTAKVTARAAGVVTVTLKPSSKARTVLARKHKLAITVTVVFTPKGGVASTQHKKVTLLLPAKKKKRTR